MKTYFVDEIFAVEQVDQSENREDKSPRYKFTLGVTADEISLDKLEVVQRDMQPHIAR